MTFVNIGGMTYPATISGKVSDAVWGGRASKSIRLEMPIATALETFTDSVPWSIITENEVPDVDENGEATGGVTINREEFDNSEYSIAGDVTDHRDGTVTVKMGKLTELELTLELMLGGM